jgi:D-alanyl-lipoteichoic acid acyltransferase DltB (MBOAT superfamily)
LSPTATEALGAHSAIVVSRIRALGTVALVSCQLVLVLLVVNNFQLENRTFFNILVLSTAGFVIHALLPLQYRLLFFSLLSLEAIILALGIFDAGALVILGLVLIGICHLPIRLAFRVSLLLGVGALFAVWRLELLPTPWAVGIWPLLASMFMFRLALYLYAIQHDQKRPTVAQTLGYFFMLPNICFPLYPVIDYTTFVRNYYDRAADGIYQTGIRWIVRGLLHLILYRFVYLYLTSDPTELETLGDLVQFLLATFLLYLRVSGQFHLCIGMLYLFGFRLPETHHLYYLAESFTDFWRRINIYWKDFMMKLVYYPSYFQLRGWGDKTALILATVVVFLGTWLLHSYQWFWLRGDFPLEPQDALFWGILGMLVVFGSLREMKRPRKRRLGRGPSWSPSLAVRTVGTFMAICILWSLWSAESLIDWIMMWTAAGNATSADLWLISALALSGLLIAGRPWSARETRNDLTLPFHRQPAVRSAALLVGMLLIGYTPLYDQFIPQLSTTVASLQRSTLNAHDKALQHKGYYEKLDNESRMSAQLWDTQAKKPADWDKHDAKRLRDDFMRHDLRPGARSVFKGALLTTNSWGMRDRDRALAKPASTYRIAVLGPSIVMGAGVADSDTFTRFLEARLNASLAPRTGMVYEVLNFGVSDYSLLQQLAMLDERAMSFQPDAIFITDSQGSKGRVVRDLSHVLVKGVEIPYPELKAHARRLGVTAIDETGLPIPFESIRAVLSGVGIKTRMLGREAASRLRAGGDSLVEWTLNRIGAVARELGAVPVFVALNNVMDPFPGETHDMRRAAAAGFLVFDLLNIWQNRDKPALRIAEWDEHPNASGHKLIADRLFQLLKQNRFELRLDQVAPALDRYARAAP